MKGAVPGGPSPVAEGRRTKSDNGSHRTCRSAGKERQPPHRAVSELSALKPHHSLQGFVMLMHHKYNETLRVNAVRL